MNMPTLSAQELTGVAAEIVRMGGSSPEEADMVAANLVEANLQGHDSHGVGMIPRYIQALRQGGLKANTPAKLLADHGAILVFDGQGGYGQVVARQVMRAGVERAKTTGVCITSLKSAHHLGRIGAWAEQCAEAGLVSIHFANVYSRAIVAPFNGADRRLGTNPFCVGVPRAGHAPLILDFATSSIASGKVRVASNLGESLEPGVAIDVEGKPTVDPSDILKEPMGALLPFGKHKGGGLALICSLLGAALTGSPTERLTKPGDLRIVNGMLSIIVNPAMLGGAESFEDEIEAFLPWVRESRPIAGEVLFPGEPEQRRKAIRVKDGIDVDDETWRQLMEAKASLER
ncbi:malate/lactate/ureidoglycolate dehydrogenase [Telmatospirillum siberiense]|uniref:Malate/lactate/ureidoglycolate dehydrogenase n=1 Tax=Telmatospirillum siberiense TaxID=382514 RepID=A0A2N3PZ75_9PROT|nr:malate/lactate/ureidoglycolate dehydrogenase [Telmatospirillum siberiense]PKU25712.1 malate/lactate/ureidoglycolate dehydrogenase [Telmatospirillum siberiense]